MIVLHFIGGPGMDWRCQVKHSQPGYSLLLLTLMWDSTHVQLTSHPPSYQVLSVLSLIFLMSHSHVSNAVGILHGEGFEDY